MGVKGVLLKEKNRHQSVNIDFLRQCVLYKRKFVI